MRVLFVLLLLLTSSFVFAQDGDTDAETEAALEQVAENENAEITEETDTGELEKFRAHPVNVNYASGEDLEALTLFSPLQIRNLLRYRHVFGLLLHTYELQAVPSWSIRTIKRALPYITVAEQPSGQLLRSLGNTTQSLQVRYGRIPEASKGIADKSFAGSAAKISIRYKYDNSNLIRAGFTAEKDAGEPFLDWKRKTGFDFYSFFLQVKKTGFIESLIIGDFTVNMAQGLMQWQSLAFKKSATVLNIKRQSAVTRPYTGAGESNFFRGAAMSMQRGRSRISLFTSFHKLSANLEETADHKISISSILTSGYHRTLAEIRDRNNITQFSSGVVMAFSGAGWQVGSNSIYHHYSYPVLKNDAPYNLFALKGRSFFYTSIDYSFTFRNVHVFGEMAVDKNRAPAGLNGLLVSLDRKIDAAVLYRRISRRYQPIAANAFTENTLPVNEEGMYVGLSFRPSTIVSIDGYIDVFYFPWIRYRVNAASGGEDFLLSVVLKPNKRVESYLKFKAASAALNESGTGIPLDPVTIRQKLNLRLHTTMTINKAFIFQHRFELTVCKNETGGRAEGKMLYINLACKPPLRRWSANGRMQYFDIDSYEARIYAYETGVPGMFSIPSLYGRGKRYLLNVNYQFSSGKPKKWKLHCSVGWQRTCYAGQDSIGTGLDQTYGNRRSAINLQLVLHKTSNSAL